MGLKDKIDEWLGKKLELTEDNTHIEDNFLTVSDIGSAATPVRFTHKKAVKTFPLKEHTDFPKKKFIRGFDVYFEAAFKVRFIVYEETEADCYGWLRCELLGFEGSYVSDDVQTLFDKLVGNIEYSFEGLETGTFTKQRNFAWFKYDEYIDFLRSFANNVNTVVNYADKKYNKLNAKFLLDNPSWSANIRKAVYADVDATNEGYKVLDPVLATHYYAQHKALQEMRDDPYIEANIILY